MFLAIFHYVFFFFFNDTATTEIYTLSLPTLFRSLYNALKYATSFPVIFLSAAQRLVIVDRKSTRLNSSHPSISYAVFCLKKKTTHTPIFTITKHTPNLP